MLVANIKKRKATKTSEKTRINPMIDVYQFIYLLNLH